MFLTGRTGSDINRMTAVGINARRRTDGDDIIDSRTAFQCALAMEILRPPEETVSPANFPILTSASPFADAV